MTIGICTSTDIDYGIIILVILRLTVLIIQVINKYWIYSTGIMNNIICIHIYIWIPVCLLYFDCYYYFQYSNELLIQACYITWSCESIFCCLESSYRGEIIRVYCVWDDVLNHQDTYYEKSVRYDTLRDICIYIHHTGIYIYIYIASWF